MQKLLSIKEVAEKYGKTESQVRYAITQRRLLGTKIGWCWSFNANKLPDKWPVTPREEKRMGRVNKVE